MANYPAGPQSLVLTGCICPPDPASRWAACPVHTCAHLDTEGEMWHG